MLREARSVLSPLVQARFGFASRFGVVCWRSLARFRLAAMLADPTLEFRRHALHGAQPNFNVAGSQILHIPLGLSLLYWTTPSG